MLSKAHFFSFLFFKQNLKTMSAENKDLSQSVSNLSLSTVAKRRMRTSKEEMAILEQYFVQNRNPNNDQKKEIATVVQMSERSIHFWYITNDKLSIIS